MQKLQIDLLIPFYHPFGLKNCICEQRKGELEPLLLGVGLHPCSTSWLCQQFLAKHELTDFSPSAPGPEDMTNTSDSAPCF